jgi:hypothetical protein
VDGIGRGVELMSRQKSYLCKIENRGAPLDIELDEDPKASRDGRDVQVEGAVNVLMDLLKKHPPAGPLRPVYPGYHGKA